MESKMIFVEVVQNDIEHRIPLAEIRDLLVAEIGSVTWTITKAQLELKVALAVDNVIQKIRDTK